MKIGAFDIHWTGSQGIDMLHYLTRNNSSG